MKLHELKEKLVKEINESELPIDAVYFVVKEVLSAISMLYNDELLQHNNKQDEHSTEEQKDEILEIKEEK